MPEPDAAAAARDRRERLLAGLRAVEEALDAAPHDPATWIGHVRLQTVALRDVLHEHVAEAEGGDGLLDQVTDEAPWLSRRADELRHEHPELIALAEETLTGWPESAAPGAVRAHVEPLLRRSRKHRERGTSLLMDAYQLDLSPGD